MKSHNNILPPQFLQAARARVVVACLVASLLCAACAAHAQIASLTGITVFDTDMNGTFQDNMRYDTNPNNNNNFKVWIVDTAHPGIFLNGPNQAQAAVSLALSPGQHTYNIYLEPHTNNGTPVIPSFAGMNLFFGLGNSTSPDISVFAPVQTTPGVVPAFSPTAGTTLLLNNGTGLGSGVLEQKNHDTHFVDVTLTDFAFAEPSVNNVDLVDGFSVAPSGQPDFVGTFTLSVAPAPSGLVSLIVVIGAGALFARLRRRTRASHAIDSR